MPPARPYAISLARPGDVPHIAAIERAAAQLLRGHAPASALLAVTDEPCLRAALEGGRLWVALAGDAPVGFAHVELLAPDLPHLEELDVHPDHGRRGLGRALVQAVCHWAAERYSQLTLTTFRDVPWNMPFYARMGFIEVPPEETRPEVMAIVAEEAARGLDPARRVVMRRTFA
jgi:GNAT superfamily N-acetyltransferase